MYNIAVLVFFSKEERMNPAVGVDLSLFQKLFIWLQQVLVTALSCGMRDLVPCPSIEPGPLAFGAPRLSHWTTREVTEPFF